jgi:hypothetical protein
MKQITGLLANKRIVSSIILLSGVLFFSYGIQENSQKIKRVTNLESGIQTCFSRVNQTYTAKLLNEQTSQYLSQNFQSLTEECFAEGILNVEDNLKIDLPVLAKKLSNLASNVHWFHEDSLLPANATRTLAPVDDTRNFGSRFEAIETTKDDVLDAAELFKAGISTKLNREKNYFYVTSALLVLMLVLEYIANANRKISNAAREIEASEELEDRDGIESVKIGEIIGVALEQNNLANCAKLFRSYYSHRSGIHIVKTLSKEIHALESMITPNNFVKDNLQGRNVLNKSIDEIWNDDQAALSLDHSSEKTEEFNLNQVSARAIDLLAEKIFSLGVQLKIVIAEHITIKGREEELEQVFFHLLSSAISSSSNSAPISMLAQRLGDIVILDLVFKSDGAANLVSAIDMKICQTLLDEINAKIKIDNTLDQLGNVNGARVKVIFIAGQDLHNSNQKVQIPSNQTGRDLSSESL